MCGSLFSYDGIPEETGLASASTMAEKMEEHFREHIWSLIGVIKSKEGNHLQRFLYSLLFTEPARLAFHEIGKHEEGPNSERWRKLQNSLYEAARRGPLA